MNAEINKQIARSFLQSVDDVDFEAWRAIASPDLVASANGGAAMNREEFEGMVRGIVGVFSNGRHIIETQVVEGDRVATRLTWTALHTGEFNGVQASNRPVRVCGDAFDRIEGGSRPPGTATGPAGRSLPWGLAGCLGRSWTRHGSGCWGCSRLRRSFWACGSGSTRAATSASLGSSRAVLPTDSASG